MFGDPSDLDGFHLRFDLSWSSWIVKPSLSVSWVIVDPRMVAWSAWSSGACTNPHWISSQYWFLSLSKRGSHFDLTPAYLTKLLHCLVAPGYWKDKLYKLSGGYSGGHNPKNNWRMSVVEAILGIGCVGPSWAIWAKMQVFFHFLHEVPVYAHVQRITI